MAVLGSGGVAAAAGEAPPAPPSPLTGVGLGAQVGFFNANGVTLRAGYGAIALEGSAGFALSLLSYGSDRNPDLKLIAPFEVSPQVLLGDIPLTKTIHGSFRLGYRYNVALGHGGTVGGQVARRWTHWQLEGLWGVTVYPGATDRLREDGRVPAETSFNFPPSVNWGLTVGMLYYP
jgi:hypothetical protein